MDDLLHLLILLVACFTPVVVALGFAKRQGPRSSYYRAPGA